MCVFIDVCVNAWRRASKSELVSVSVYRRPNTSEMVKCVYMCICVHVWVSAGDPRHLNWSSVCICVYTCVYMCIHLHVYAGDPTRLSESSVCICVTPVCIRSYICMCMQATQHV